MKKVIALLMALCMVFALCACGSTATTTATAAPAAATEAPAAATEAPAAATEAATAEPTKDANALPVYDAANEGPAYDYTTAAAAPAKTDDVWGAAYAVVDQLAEMAKQYDSSKATYRYTCNCHDPLASAPGEFLTAWSNAVLVATEGQVYIDIGVSNAYCTEGTMETLNQMEAGAIDFDWTLPCYFKGYMPLTNAIQNPALGIKNAIVGSYAMWDLYKNNADVAAEYDDDGEVLFVWTNNPSPLLYKGDKELTSLSEITSADNIRGNNGPAQMFITQIGATIKGCPITELQTNLGTGVLQYAITDWHGIASFKLYEKGYANYYLDTNIGCSAYCLLANFDKWAEIEANGYADAIKSVSGDYLLNLVPLWQYYEALGRYDVVANGGTIYAPSDALAAELQTAYEAVAQTWVADNGASAQSVYDQAVSLVNQYNGIYG